MIRKCIGLLKKLFHKIKWHIKLKEMDDWWYFTGGNCFGLFPPSFYYTHTEEEIKQITEETIGRLRAMIAEYEAEYCTKKEEPDTDALKVEG